VMASRNLLPSERGLSPWGAKLHLCADQSNGRSTVRKTLAEGPLQIQKVLYPEGQAVAHAFVLHPPSGIAQEDQLEIRLVASGGSHSVFSTPGATRWYKSSPQAISPSLQSVTLELKDRAMVEWLPYENLYFDQTWACNHLAVKLEPGCRLIGWDIHQFGRTSCKEPWLDGRTHNTVKFFLSNRLLWSEHAHWQSDNLHQPFDSHQLGEFSIVGTLWAFGPKLHEKNYEELAAGLPAHADCIAGVSQLAAPAIFSKGTVSSAHTTQDPEEALIIMRLLSNDPEIARSLCEQTRAYLRPLLTEKAATELRIWAT
jgi:urease accessory protein